MILKQMFIESLHTDTKLCAIICLEQKVHNERLVVDENGKYISKDDFYRRRKGSI